jgi:magnesium-transporting ATPase (P-type)
MSAVGSWLADADSMQTVMEVQALEPWRRDAGDVAAGQGVDVRQGLTSEEAAARVERYGPNELESEVAVPAWRRLLAQFADPLIYLLFAAVVVSIVAWIVEGADGLPFDAIVITAIVFVNGMLGYVQEARAEEAVAALQRMAAATAGVRRDGRARHGHGDRDGQGRAPTRPYREGADPAAT